MSLGQVEGWFQRDPGVAEFVCTLMRTHVLRDNQGAAPVHQPPPTLTELPRAPVQQSGRRRRPLTPSPAQGCTPT